MCPKDLVCDRKTWYVPERPGMFSKILACVRKLCHMCTQLMTDNLLQIITRFLYLRMIFMDNVGGVPSMRICAPRSWYVIERPGTFLKDLACSRKSWLVLENAVICAHN